MIPDDYRVLHDHKAGLVLPERAIAGYAELAMRRGAELHGREAVVNWEVEGGAVTVRTTKQTYRRRESDLLRRGVDESVGCRAGRAVDGNPPAAGLGLAQEAGAV